MGGNNIQNLGPLMNALGDFISNIAGSGSRSIFLFVESAPGWVSPSLFKEEEDVVRYLEAHEKELSDKLLDIWLSLPSNKRWAVMEYDIKDGNFSVTFQYPDEVDVDSIDEDRREIALRARYGDKRVVYPAPPEGSFKLKA